MTAFEHRLEGTPEHYLSVPKEREADTDAINCTILRAQALVALLCCQFEKDGGSRLSDELMTNALWGIEGHLDQLQAMCVHFDKGNE